MVIWQNLENKTRTSKVGAISEAQKGQNIFLEKKLEIFENFLFRKKVTQCRKKNRKGDSLVPSGFVGYLEKVKKNERGTPSALSLPWPLGRTRRLR